MTEFMIEETFVPAWPDSDRIPYPLFILRFSELCNSYCRSKIHSLYFGKQGTHSKWDLGEDGLAWAYEQMDSSYSPIETLMVEVAYMILDGGRHFESDQWMNYHCTKIKEILQKNDLETMLSKLPQQEREYFETDLKLLKPIGLFDKV